MMRILWWVTTELLNTELSGIAEDWETYMELESYFVANDTGFVFNSASSVTELAYENNSACYKK